MDILSPDPGLKDRVGGRQRVCPAEDTLARILPLKDLFGITRIANVTGLDRVGLPVFLATRPNARSVAVSQGKGIREADARASALMEAVEIWHAEHYDRPMRFSSVRELSNAHALIDIGRLPEVAGSRFDVSLRMLWAEAVDLMGGDDLLVPFEMVHADYTHPVQPGHGCFPASTNGLSSGNHPLEAICHGICEVVERDALAIWHYAPAEQQARRGVDPASVDDADCLAAMARIEAAGLRLGIWDLTSDIGVATFLCAVLEDGAAAGHVGIGSGTHLERGVALRRALTEAAQTRLNYISGARDDLMPAEFTAGGRDEKAVAVRRMLENNPCARPFSTVPTQRNETLKEDLACLLDALRGAGVDQVAAVDLARSEVDIPVVRIIIPGLEAPHDDVTYVPGQRAFQGFECGKVPA
ncbi:YcaO-like family protein [Hoeflea poritis]|uniref:YcaO-like family protein n=1 Tax=Hoeflea poritis TaxID=2993659 RepID=A0ABT4VNU3_9HYPH|nr:YcaO-like family protein [Hoeflea poritis]MDA4846393.1 YcaO-like family protein [Hoeflea poritis]